MLSLLIALTLLQPPQQDTEYRIGPDDVVEVIVFGQAELSGASQVSSAGLITLPRIGTLKAAGQDTRSVAREVEEMLRKTILVDPHVTVFVKQVAVPQAISVTGAVRNVGVYPFRRGQALLEVITKAGGLTENAGSLIQITRQADTGIGHTPQSLLVDTEDLVDKGKPEANIPIQSGDIINVPRGYPISVTGEVLKPGDLTIRFGKSVTIRDVIQQTGGLTERAGSVIRIARAPASGSVEPEVFVSIEDLVEKGKADANVLVQAGDVVHVPRGYPISVIGEVMKPGDLPARFGRSMPVREVIQQSGGLTERASGFIRIARTSVGRTSGAAAQPEVIVISAEELLENLKPEANVNVNPGDIVTVPRGFPIVTVGELTKPSEFLLRFGKGMSLRDVVLKSGGFTKQADMRLCVIIRVQDDGEAEYITLNLERIMDPGFPNQSLKPNDILYVPSKPSKGKAVMSTGLTVAVAAATQRLILGR